MSNKSSRVVAPIKNWPSGSEDDTSHAVTAFRRKGSPPSWVFNWVSGGGAKSDSADGFEPEAVQKGRRSHRENRASIDQCLYRFGKLVKGIPD